MADLTVTAECREVRQDLSLRVWPAMDAASQYTELREELFVSASHPQTSSDGAELVFSDMEARALVNQARAMAAGTQHQAAVSARAEAVRIGTSSSISNWRRRWAISSRHGERRRPTKPWH